LGVMVLSARMIHSTLDDVGPGQKKTHASLAAFERSI
jgi:hypothetical protein